MHYPGQYLCIFEVYLLFLTSVKHPIMEQFANLIPWNIFELSKTKVLLHKSHGVLKVIRTVLFTVWPQPIWKKVRTLWQIPPQHQSTYLGGPKSAYIEIPPFRRFLWSKFSKMKNFKKFRIAPNFFFALQYYIENCTKVVPMKKIFCSRKFFC